MYTFLNRCYYFLLWPPKAETCWNFNIVLTLMDLSKHAIIYWLVDKIRALILKKPIAGSYTLELSAELMVLLLKCPDGGMPISCNSQ